MIGVILQRISFGFVVCTYKNFKRTQNSLWSHNVRLEVSLLDSQVKTVHTVLVGKVATLAVLGHFSLEPLLVRETQVEIRLLFCFIHTVPLFFDHFCTLQHSGSLRFRHFFIGFL